ncbi:AAA family ATPase [Aquaspirillum soli]
MMSLLELQNKIKSHLKAGYPGLFIHSGEEARVDVMLEQVAAELNLHPKEWNHGYGWVHFSNKQPCFDQEPEINLAQSLPTLLDDDLDNKLLIIKDACSALESQPLAVARLKQLLNRIQRHHRGKAAVVLVSETVYIPSAVESQVTLLTLPLPQGEDIAGWIKEICQQLELSVPPQKEQRLQAACGGLSAEEIRSALAMVRQEKTEIDDAALVMIQHEKEQIIAKSGVLEMIKVDKVDVGGLENLTRWLGRRAHIFHRLEEAKQANIPAPKGVLIAGMPGCGKSLTAKATAGLFQLPLLRLDIGSLLGKYVGESEHNMRRALTMAESISPCILWIDELEKAFVGMNSNNGSEVSSRLFGYFLTWMQEKTGAVFVIATANNITALPPELLRKGRFDEVFYVGFPNATERGKIFDIHLKGSGVDLQPAQRSELIALSRDYAGADIQNSVNEARESAFLDDVPLNFHHLKSAIQKTVPLRETLRDQVGKYEELFEKLKLKPASVADGLSVAEMIKLADDPNPLRRKEVAENPDCPEDLLEKLAFDFEHDVCAAVYKNPNCSERLLTIRINIKENEKNFDADLLGLACVHQNVPLELLLAKYDGLKLNREYKRLLIESCNFEPLLLKLAEDKDYIVRVFAAKQNYLSDLIHLKLSQDITYVKKALAANSSITEAVQIKLFQDSGYEVRKALAANTNITEVVQLKLCEDSNYEVKTALAANSDITEAVQLKLCEDSDYDVREALAANANITEAVQLKLCEDYSKDVRKSLAANHTLRETVQLKLCNDRSNGVRKALASNHNLTEAVQLKLCEDSNYDVRAVLAANSNITKAVKLKLG